MAKKKVRNKKVAKTGAKKIAKKIANTVTKKLNAKTKGVLAKKKTNSSSKPIKSHVTNTKTSLLKGPTLSANELVVGKPVPDFILKLTGSKQLSIQDLKGKNVVLYFYPKDATPGCTLEGHQFTQLHPEFQKVQTEVFGVSRDSLESHEKFKSKEGYCFDLISDDTGELTEKFGVWKEKSLYGRKYMGIERSTFLIDANGILQKEWRSVKPDGHAQSVLETVTSIGKIET